MRCVPDLNIWILSRSVPGSCRITSPPTRIFVHTSLEFWHKQPIRKNALLFCQNSVNIVIKQGVSLFVKKGNDLVFIYKGAWGIPPGEGVAEDTTKRNEVKRLVAGARGRLSPP